MSERLREQMIPPTINLIPDPELDLDYVPAPRATERDRDHRECLLRVRWHQQRPRPAEMDRCSLNLR